MKKIILPLLIVAALAATARCQSSQPVSLIDADKPQGGWKFENGPEFPGAQGKLELAKEKFRDQPALSLSGDFTKGGNYVQAAVALPKAKLDTLSFWVNVPAGSERLPIRLMDAANKVHQLNLKINPKGGWQRIVLPVDKFFKKMGSSSGLDIVTQYETWDGVQDREKHDKQYIESPNLAILASRAMGTLQGTILISEVLFHPGTKVTTSIAKTIFLDEMLREGEIDWGFNLGQEFAGAKGGLDLVGDQPEAGKYAMRLHADFTGGGAYVGVRKTFGQLNVQAMKVIRMKMRSKTAKSYALRLVDGTDQCHQAKNMPLTPDGKWHEIEIVPTEIAGGEHWGGANDGKWHDSVKLIELMLNVESHAGKTPELEISDVRADVAVEAAVKAPAFNEPFDASLPKGWKTTGTVGTDAPGRAESAKALLLKRILDQLPAATDATSPALAVNPGAWQVQYAWKAKLHSPDNSYHGSVELEVFNASGKLLETIPVAIGHGESDWQTVSKTVVLPPGASQAKFRVQLKKTYGSFWLDDLSASPLSVQPIEQRVQRIELATDAVGNLFLPGEDVVYHVTVEAIKPLAKAEQVVRYSLRDYWGAEQLPPGEVALQKAPRRNNRFAFTAEIDVPKDRLVVGKFYELHVAIPQASGDPVEERSGLAVLPPAPARRCAPESVPFTIRNWDSRISVYFHLADRLGLRLMGVWGGWNAKPPYKPHLPGVEICEQLGAKWITGTPAASVERQGFAEYSEEALRQGMRNFLEEYAGRGMAMIAMGNEPHGTGQKVLDNVRAYRAIYETVKAFDPKIHVIGTSVEPNEEYFKAGYQNYLDSYDFHIYEHYSNVRRTIREYRALMKKYDAVKPIHSTELGLNSQGQTRHAVALEMIKKFTVFFAEGGDTVSWFTIQYPDSEGKARGQFGNAHCVFDCKYNLYNPRLDAITHYNIVNGICDKKFVQQQQYPNGAQAFLFRNKPSDCLQVLWLDNDRQDVLVPLPAGQKVELVRLDGARTMLESVSGGITVTLSAEPALLLYHDAKAALAKTLGTPAASLAAVPEAIAAGSTATFALQGPGLTAASLRVDGPPLWKATLKQPVADKVACTVAAPESTPAREGRIHVQLLSGGKAVGELAVPIRLE